MSKDSSDNDNTTPDEVEVEIGSVATERVLVDFWQFSEYAKLVLGEDEYRADPQFWSNQFERDYETIKERLEIERKIVSGEINPEVLDISEELTPTEFIWERLGGLRLLSFEQFVLEFNQGIFREDRFYCDKGRAWLKKVRKTLSECGFPYVRKVKVEGRMLLEVSKNTMGVI